MVEKKPTTGMIGFLIIGVVFWLVVLLPVFAILREYYEDAKNGPKSG